MNVVRRIGKFPLAYPEIRIQGLIIASINIVINALGAYYTFPVLGIVAGTMISFFMALIWILMMGQG